MKASNVSNENNIEAVEASLLKLLNDIKKNSPKSAEHYKKLGDDLQYVREMYKKLSNKKEREYQKKREEREKKRKKEEKERKIKEQKEIRRREENQRKRREENDRKMREERVRRRRERSLLTDKNLEIVYNRLMNNKLGDNNTKLGDNNTKRKFKNLSDRQNELLERAERTKKRMRNLNNFVAQNRNFFNKLKTNNNDFYSKLENQKDKRNKFYSTITNENLNKYGNGNGPELTNNNLIEVNNDLELKKRGRPEPRKDPVMTRGRTSRNRRLERNKRLKNSRTRGEKSKIFNEYKNVF